MRKFNTHPYILYAFCSRVVLGTRKTRGRFRKHIICRRSTCIQKSCAPSGIAICIIYVCIFFVTHIGRFSSLSICMYIYIYIHVYIYHMCTYIYICIFTYASWFSCFVQSVACDTYILSSELVCGSLISLFRYFLTFAAWTLDQVCLVVSERQISRLRWVG